MRTVAFWLTSILLVVIALSATVAMATVNWLYPGAGKAAPSRVSPSPPSVLPQPGVDARTPVKVPEPVVPTGGPEEAAALNLLRRAAGGDIEGALDLASTLTEAALTSQVTQLAPTPIRAARLPGPDDGAVPLLVWTEYHREGVPARGAYLMSVAAGKVSALTGPLAPEGGYGPLPWVPLDERADPVDMRQYKGRGLLLVAPRAPEQGLLETLEELRASYGTAGLEVILVIDIRAPDWVRIARAAGFTGPVWRLKGKLEDVPVVTPGSFLGAVGLLIDRTGEVVASLAALDPARYGLHDQPAGAVAPFILKAYDLVP